MVAHRRAALSCSRRSPRGRTSGLGAPREPRAYRCTGSAAGERGQRHALWFCLSAYCTRLELRAFVGSVDPVCPGLTAPGALPLAQRLRLPPGPTTVVAPAPLLRTSVPKCPSAQKDCRERAPPPAPCAWPPAAPDVVEKSTNRDRRSAGVGRRFDLSRSFPRERVVPGVPQGAEVSSLRSEGQAS